MRTGRVRRKSECLFSHQEFQMTAGDQYRIRAAQFEAQAKRLTTLTTRAGFLSLARAYVRLAELADRNEHTDIVMKFRNSGVAARQADAGFGAARHSPPQRIPMRFAHYHLRSCTNSSQAIDF